MTDTIATSPVPVANWGRDHWTTYAYIAHCIINGSGIPERERMRCSPSTHPDKAHRGTTGEYHTRLKDGTNLFGHDDWSCLEDAASAGLVEIRGTGLSPMYAFTPPGWDVWFQFQQHISENPNNWSTTFTPKGMDT